MRVVCFFFLFCPFSDPIRYLQSSVSPHKIMFTIVKVQSRPARLNSNEDKSRRYSSCARKFVLENMFPSLKISIFEQIRFKFVCAFINNAYAI